MEIWKDVKNYEGRYQVSNLGRVKSLCRKKEIILKSCPNTNGYYIVNLPKDKKPKTHRVHKLVAMAFLNHEPCGMGEVVHHIDNDKSNNRLSNLKIVSQRENALTHYERKYTKLKGAHWCKQIKRWKSSILIDGKVKRLGTFDTEEQAHEAYMNEYLKQTK